MATMVGMYLALGAVAGILAGLMGIGGGLVIVPMLVFCFSLLNFPHAHIMHIALGTSLASIVFTSISSMLAHHRRGAVRWDILLRFTPGILVGGMLGSYIASRLTTNFLEGMFGVFVYYVAFQFLLDKKPEPARKLPGQAGMFGMGGLIGTVASLMGIGGGTLSVPFLIWCNITVHRAIGTSAAIGFPIAVAGALGYMYTGQNVTGLPEYSVGFVYLPALLGIVVASMLTAPMGVKLAHWLPVSKLKRIFAILLIVVGTKLLVSLL